MKIKIIICGLILFALMFQSCDNLLDVTPKSSITGQIYWQNESDFAPYLNGIYSSYRSAIDNSIGLAEDRSEMWIQAINARFTPYWAQNILPGNTVDWTSYYGIIGNVNLLIEKIEPFPFSSESTKNRIAAEAYTMRAAMYFFLARVWGDVPLVLESVKDEKAPLYARTAVGAVFTQINADLTKALSLYPDQTYSNKNKWTKPAAYALLADVKMWSATVLKGGAPDFTAATDAITVVENSGVALESTYGNVFDNRKNNEIIFSLFLNRSEYTSTGINFGISRFDVSGSATNAADLPLSLIGQAGYILSPRALELFAANPADKRISRTYIAEINGTVVRYVWPNKFRGTKYADDRVPDNDFIIYRLSDMQLLKAEAYAALDQSANAIVSLNKVRTRAGIPDYVFTNKAALQKAILDERGRELFHEYKRWYDLMRANAMGVIDVKTFIPNYIGKTTPLYWAVHTNVLAKNNLLVQTTGY